MIKRIYSEKLTKLLDGFPVVAILGPRQSGKTTLVTQLLEEERKYYNLDDINILELAKKNPEHLLDRSENITIDEIQRCPELLLAIKKMVDEKRVPGKFIITGSANITLLPDLQESLAGRVAFLDIYPLTLFEMLSDTKTLPGLVQLLQGNTIDEIEKQKPNIEKSIFDYFFLSSYPEPYLNKDLDYNQEWFKGYIRTYLERDILQLKKIHELSDYQRLLSIANTRVGGILNKKDLGKDAGISAIQCDRYLNLLYLSYQLYEVQPFYRNIAKRFIKAPKIYSMDTALSTYLQGLKSLEDINRLNKTGALIENIFIKNIKILLEHYIKDANLYFYNIHGGGEIDCVISANQRLYPIEIKATSKLNNINTHTMKTFLKTFKNESQIGYILYLGKEIIPIEKNIIAVPWELLLT